MAGANEVVSGRMKKCIFIQWCILIQWWKNGKKDLWRLYGSTLLELHIDQTVWMIPEGHIKIPDPRVLMVFIRPQSVKKLMTVDEAKEVWRDCSIWHSILFGYLARRIKHEAKKILLSHIYISNKLLKFTIKHPKILKFIVFFSLVIITKK